MRQSSSSSISSEVWRALAGPASALELSGPPRDADPALERELEEMRELFAGHEPVARLFAFRELAAGAPRRQWAESRRCLARALRVALKSARPGAIHVSLSHCADRCIAIAAAGEDVRGVGVDLERKDRPLSEAAISRIRAAAEAGFSGLETWILKEACYKADPRNANGDSGAVVANYELSRPEGSRIVRAHKGGMLFSAGFCEEGEHLVGLAVVRDS